MQAHDAAVFSRNHLQYLEEAAEIAAASPDTPVTFRSSQPWSTAKRIVSEKGQIPIYFAVIDGSGLVSYQAWLVKVVTDPERGDKQTEEALRHALPSTSGEGLWGDGASPAKTLYSIADCRALETSFPMTALVRLDGDKAIHSKYGYSYCLVHAVDPRRIALEGSANHTDEVRDAERYPEGATHEICVNAYERSTAARQACVAHQGARCAICGFDFGKAYGRIGEGFIHVHHVIPLSKIDEAYQVDPASDLVPVCPNCHAMLHRNTDTTLTPNQLRDIIVKQGWLPRFSEEG